MMNTKRVGKFWIDFYNQWDAILNPKKFNWVDFNLIQIYFEDDRRHGNKEIILYLLGFGIRVYWVYDRETNDKKMKEYQKILEKEEFVEVNVKD